MSELMRQPLPCAGPVERQSLERGSAWWTVHVSRYRYAADQIRRGRVLDIACGTGYGLSMLAEHARVVGVDVDKEAAMTARGHVGEGVLLGDGRKLPFRDQSFDAAVSFETIEHFHHRELFVSELARVLTASGVLILSTPNANHTVPIDGKPRNPFHVHEYTPEELKGELSRAFDSVEMKGQVLDPRFRVPPMWDEQQQLVASGGLTRVLTWRALARFPRRIGDAGSRLLWHHPLFPEVNDYRFLESEVDHAPVLVASCTRPRR